MAELPPFSLPLWCCMPLTPIGSGTRVSLAALQRFPMPALVATGSCLFFLSELGDASLRTRIGIVLASIFLVALAVDLTAEARNLGPRQRFVAMALGCAAIGIFVGLALTADFNAQHFLVGLALAVGILPFLVHSDGETGYWQFNHDLWIAAAAGCAAALLFAGGIFSIVFSIGFLFGLRFDIAYKVWILAATLVGPFCWLSLIPRTDVATTGGYDGSLASRAIATLTKLLLVPLLFAYAVVLHAYAVKIALDFAVPKGQVGWMVLSFGSLLALTGLLVFPMREDKSRLLRVFRRAWPVMLAAPTVLLFLAGLMRVDQYGFTESRYFLLLIGTWFALVALTQAFASPLRDIRVLVAMLAVLLVVSSFGPWGIYAFPPRAQANEFATRLAAAGLLKEGNIVADGDQARPLLPTDKQRLAAITTYLAARQQLHLLRPLFKDAANDPFASASAPTARSQVLLRSSPTPADYALAGAIQRRLGIGGVPVAGSQVGNRLTYSASSPYVIDTGGKSALTGPYFVFSQNTDPSKTRFQPRIFGGRLSVSFDGYVVSARDETGREARFDLAGSAHINGQLRQDTPRPPGPEARPVLALEKSGGELDAVLHLTQTHASQEGDKLVFHSFQAWIAVTR